LDLCQSISSLLFFDLSLLILLLFESFSFSAPPYLVDLFTVHFSFSRDEVVDNSEDCEDNEAKNEAQVSGDLAPSLVGDYRDDANPSSKGVETEINDVEAVDFTRFRIPNIQRKHNQKQRLQRSLQNNVSLIREETSKTSDQELYLRQDHNKGGVVL
jgi:hypothetical protein